jgi:hypothetical protein
MSQQVDADLVELARRWIERLRPVGAFITGSFHFGSDWRVEYALYQSLLDAGCKPIGRYHEYVYMHCNNKLVVAGIIELFSRIKDLGSQVRELERSEWERLIDGIPCAWLSFNPLYVGVCGKEPVEVVKLRIDYLYVKETGEERVRRIYLGDRYDLYLHSAWLSAWFSSGSLKIGLMPYGVARRYIDSIDFIWVKYKFGDSSEIEREITVRINGIDRTLWDEKVERVILESLNKRASIIDELLSQAEPLIYEPFKRLVIYVLY